MSEPRRWMGAGRLPRPPFLSAATPMCPTQRWLRTVGTVSALHTVTVAVGVRQTLSLLAHSKRAARRMHSIFDPASPEAMAVTRLWWWLFGAGLVIWLSVVAVAVRAGLSARGAPGS